MKFWSQNLTSKIASSFLLLSLITVGAVGSVAFFNARESLKRAAFDRLSVSATLKEEEISRWFENQERDFLLITQFPDVQRNLKILLQAKPDHAANPQPPDYQSAHQVVSTYLTQVANLKPNFQEISIIDRSSRIILSTDPSRQGKYEILANVTYLEKVEPGDSFAPLFYVSPETGKPTVTLAASLRDASGQRQGVILAHLNLDRIDQIVRERSGLGDSGETYLVGSLISEHTFISREALQPQELTRGVSSRGIDLAMQGLSGSGLYQNYANVPVIGVYHWLNELDLALLVEMNQDEAFAPARHLAATIMLVGVMSLGGLAIGVWWLTHQLQLSRQQLENYSHQLEQKAQEANAANRAKSEFLANMSHELRTPLNAILGFTQLMSRDRLINPDQLANLEIIGRSGEHLLTLINDVLEMSKIEAGRVTLNQNSFDLYHLLRSLEEMLQIKAHSKGLSLIFDRTPAVPQYVQTDEGKLRQVLINLLDNAIKFTQGGRVMLRVGVGSREALRSSVVAAIDSPTCPESPQAAAAVDQLWFEVSDTGSGIASAELGHLFEPFVQAESGRKLQQGTGLGLPISQKFVHLMGGDITIDSSVGQGTSFAFDIQICPVEKAEVATHRPHRQVIGLKPDQLPYRILIVEDKWENRQLLVKILTSVGFEVRQAENGLEGVKVWQSWEPHLIWMDMRMPVMDGFEATKQIRSQLKGQATVIIALTASAFAESRSIVLSAGCDDFVPKPFREQMVFDKMAEHLGVQYRYATPQDDQAVKNALVLPLSTSDLGVMPSDWIEKLWDAAIKVDASQIRTLIKEIPATAPRLSEALTDLVDRFCFDEIIALTQR